MPVYYNADKKTWYTTFYAKDYKGINKKYKKDEDYYLVVKNVETKIEERKKIIIDILFSDDFGF